MPGYELSRIVEAIVSEEHMKEFICGICTGVLLEPTVTQCCGQTYCFDCINEWVEQFNACPNDGEVQTTDQLKPSPKMVTNLLNDMRIKCDFHEKGCKAVVKIIDLVKHKENDCAFNPFRFCDNCGEIKLNHSEKDCIKRLATKLDDLQKENQKDKDQIDLLKVGLERSERLIIELKKEIAQLKELVNFNPSDKDSTERFSYKQLLGYWTQYFINVGTVDNPRGSKSAFAFFAHECREEHRQRHPNENFVFSEFSEKCAKQWSAMNDREKNRFNELAEIDKKRCQEEMANDIPPKGDMGGKKRKSANDPNEPKPPHSALFLFCKDVPIMDNMNDLSVSAVTKEIERRWNECTEDQKSKYIALADKDKARYENEMKAYKPKKSKPAPLPEKEESDDDEGQEEDEEEEEREAEDDGEEVGNEEEGEEKEASYEEDFDDD